MKKYITRTIKITSLVLAVFCATWLLQKFILCHPDHNKLRINGFYLEEPNTLDVVFMGASEMYTSFAPGLAYDKFGFTSYSYATASVTAGAITTQFKEIMRTQDPQLIVVEINPFLYPDDKNENNEGSIRKYIDNVPYNENKREYIKSLATEDEIEYHIPFIKYHNSWTEYPGGIKFAGAMVLQNLRGYTLLKGYKTNTGICPLDDDYLNQKLINDDTTLDLYPLYEEKLRETLSYCSENNIKNVLFIRAPHLLETESDYEAFCRTNAAEKIIKEYGFDFINFERDRETMSYNAHMYYNRQHLNVYGSKSFTEYFGEILSNKYGVSKAQLTDRQKSQWNEAAEYYYKFYKCCDEMTMSDEKAVEIEEDLFGIREIEKHQ